MKLTLLITSFTLLPPVVISGILRGLAELDKKKQHPRKLSGSGQNGCPPTAAKGGPAAAGYTLCTVGSDCTTACSTQGAGCCCVAGGTPYCGVPSDCNDFLTCTAAVAPTPSPTTDDRGVGGPGGVIDGITVDANGCIAVSQEWCPILNQCVLADTCDTTPVDDDGCAVGHPDGIESFCESRKDCILDQLWSCPMTYPTEICPNKNLVPVTITDQNGDSYTPSNGQVHPFDDDAETPTQVKARVIQGFDGPFVGEIDFTILNDEYQLYNPNPSVAACATIYNIVVYFTDSLRHVFHICFEDPFNNVRGNPNDYGIPRCNTIPQADAQTVLTWYRLEMFAYGS